MPDLWPADFGKLDDTPPITILREQADLLAKKTQGIIVATITSSKMAGPTSGRDQIRHMFSLTVPTLDNYSYLLMTVSHPIELYPANVSTHTDESFLANSPTEFMNVLQKVFAADRTLRVIQSLTASALQPSA
jgi:hypothetical protein